MSHLPTRGGSRPGAGRKPRSTERATLRPGARFTDAEWAPVAMRAEREDVPATEALRRIVAEWAAGVRE